MKQSDILSFAINGVRRELREAEQEVARLELVLEELRAIDRPTLDNEALVGSAGFVYEPVVVECSYCKMDPCSCA